MVSIVWFPISLLLTFKSFQDLVQNCFVYFCELHITALHSRAVIQNEVLNYCGGSRKYI